MLNISFLPQIHMLKPNLTTFGSGSQVRRVKLLLMKQCPYKTDIKEFSVLLTQCEGTARKQLSMNQEAVLTRHQTCWHIDLGLHSFQIMEFLKQQAEYLTAVALNYNVVPRSQEEQGVCLILQITNFKESSFFGFNILSSDY